MDLTDRFWLQFIEYQQVVLDDLRQKEDHLGQDRAGWTREQNSNDGNNELPCFLIALRF